MKIVKVSKEKVLAVFFTVIIVLGMLSIFEQESVPAFALPVSKKIILIDAGHGGESPYSY